MSPAAGRSREYWAALLVFAGLIAAWLTLPFLSGTNLGSIDEEISAGEQGLDSLGAQGASRQPPEAPGSLYSAPGGPFGDKSAEAGLASRNLAAALRNVSRSPTSDPGGWGGQKARTGFNVPRANFAAPGQTAAPNSSSASALDVSRPFGLGGDPGLPRSPAAGPPAPEGGLSRPALDSARNTQAFSSLRQASDSSRAALMTRDEAAAAGAKATFDLAQLRARGIVAPPGTPGAPDGPGLTAGGVPANLKANDPNLSLRQQDLAPPAVGPASETKDTNNKQYMEQQLMMMLLAIAVGGVLGPFFGAMGQSLARSFGFNPPTPDNMNRVSSSSPQLYKT